ncbi:hypothetical protein [Niallia circulans]|uniref:hypothetical protein n=1 Tax=Niallia circulans TaxID=1397 RepID=UPI001560CA7D|nr:hypothetical protein [Niallia circulans]NRG35093.1 hypothetical protein [Niallia circulans]
MNRIEDLIDILNKRGWDYIIEKKGNIRLILENQEIICSKVDSEGIKKIILDIINW